MYIYMYIHIHVCTCICTCICTYIDTIPVMAFGTLCHDIRVLGPAGTLVLGVSSAAEVFLFTKRGPEIW